MLQHFQHRLLAQPDNNPCTIYWILGFHSGGYKVLYLLWYTTKKSVENQPMVRRNMSPPSSRSKNKPSKKPAWIKSTIFWDITPCSPLSVNRRFGGTYRFHLQGRKNKLTKKRTTRRYIPENGTLHNHPCENLKSYSMNKIAILKHRLMFNGLHGVISQKVELLCTIYCIDRTFK
jgi:hypothetical protein